MIQYIDKSAVVAEIERRLCLLVPKMTFHQQRVELEKLLSFLDTLEVKEVDLNKEISQFIDANFGKATIGHKLNLRRVAKHFFELGINTRKI